MADVGIARVHTDWLVLERLHSGLVSLQLREEACDLSEIGQPAGPNVHRAAVLDAGKDAQRSLDAVFDVDEVPALKAAAPDRDRVFMFRRAQRDSDREPDKLRSCSSPYPEKGLMQAVCRP